MAALLNPDESLQRNVLRALAAYHRTAVHPTHGLCGIKLDMRKELVRIVLRELRERIEVQHLPAFIEQHRRELHQAFPCSELLDALPRLAKRIGEFSRLIADVHATPVPAYHAATSG